MFKDSGRPWIIDHDGEVRMSNSMKCHHITKGKRKVVKEPRGIWNKKNANKLNYNQTQITTLNNLEDDGEEPWKYVASHEQDNYGIELKKT